MFRSQVNTSILPLAVLGIVLAAAAVLLVGNAILLNTSPEQYRVQREAPLAPALNQEHRSEIDRWRTGNANSQRELAQAPALNQEHPSEIDRWEAWANYYQVLKVRQAYQVQRARWASTARLEGLGRYYLGQPAP
jgi:hypothetical protein